MAFHCVLTDSLRCHGAFTARPQRSQRLRCAFTALPRSDILKTPCCLCAKTTDDLGVCTATLVCANGAHFALEETLLRGYGDLTASPLRSMRTLSERRSTVFVLSTLKVRVIARRSMRSHRIPWRCHCVAAVILAFILRVSAFCIFSSPELTAHKVSL